MEFSASVLPINFWQKVYIRTINPSIERAYKPFATVDVGIFEGRVISALSCLANVDLISVYCDQYSHTNDTKLIDFNCEKVVEFFFI